MMDCVQWALTILNYQYDITPILYVNGPVCLCSHIHSFVQNQDVSHFRQEMNPCQRNAGNGNKRAQTPSIRSLGNTFHAEQHINNTKITSKYCHSTSKTSQMYQGQQVKSSLVFVRLQESNVSEQPNGYLCLSKMLHKYLITINLILVNVNKSSRNNRF